MSTTSRHILTTVDRTAQVIEFIDDYAGLKSTTYMVWRKRGAVNVEQNLHRSMAAALREVGIRIRPNFAN